MIRNVYISAGGAEYDTKENLKCLVTSFNGGTPTAKTLSVDIPYGDGELDLTDYFGSVRYENRTVKAEFCVIDWERAQEVYDNILALFHGKAVSLRTSLLEAFCYEGRCDVDALEDEGNYFAFSLEINAAPYKLKKETTEVSATISCSGQLVCANDSMSVCPVITSTSAISIAYDGNTFAISANKETQLSGLVLAAGNNVLDITVTDGGSADVTVTYREGRL